MSLGSWLAAQFGCDNCQKMHRRAQAAESAAARVLRQNAPERLWRTVAYLKYRADRHWDKMVLWKWRYRALTELARSKGATDADIMKSALAGDAMRLKHTTPKESDDRR